jgi:hypothetical protein
MNLKKTDFWRRKHKKKEDLEDFWHFVANKRLRKRKKYLLKMPAFSVSCNTTNLCALQFQWYSVLASIV